jgi:DNA-binding transcriptional LysR family regulator
VELEVGDRLLDMTRERIDIAIRTGSNLPDTVVARQIGTLGARCTRAPATRGRRGLPRARGARAHTLITNSAVPC